MQIKIDTQNIAETLFILMIPMLKDLLENMIVSGNVVASKLSPNITSDDDLLDQAQVAKMIRMSTDWLEKKRCVGGGIPFSKMGGSVRYKRKDVIDFVHSRTFRNTCEVTFDKFNDNNPLKH